MSSNVDSGMLKNILKGILRSSSALTFGSTVLPSTSSTPRWKQVTARKIPPLSQWFVERHNFEEAVTAEYASMQPSEIRLVVAGTGVGKTTKLPYSIAKTHQVCGIVLMPEFDFMLDTHAYMAGNSMYSAVRFDRLRSSVIRQPDAGVTVYYSTAADFLSHLTNHPDLCATLRIGFIFLDEQHVPRPDYTFIPYLVDAGILKGIKVLYGTATANSSADISMEGGVKRTMIKKPASHFPSDPRDVKPGYPMHESQIVSRTIIFLADESEIQAWLLYYEAHDVPTVVYGHASSPDMLSMVRKHLENNPVSVCLTCRLETTVTLNVDVAIDAGRSLRLVYDMENAAVKLHIAPATNAQQTQRAGRVARYKPGTVFKAEVPNSPPADPYSYEQSVYIFLWAKKFNITIRQPAVAMWEEPFGNLTQVNTAILLSSRIPPLLQYAYLSDDGLFSGWDHMKKLLYDPTGVRVTLDSCSKAVQGWTELSTGPQPFMTAPAVFRVRITPPREWLPLFYWAYVQYMESDDCADDFDARTYAPSVTTRSVIVPRASLTRKDTVKSRGSVIQNQATPEIRDLRQTIDARSVCYSTAEPFTMKGFNFKPTNRITEVEEDDMVSVSRDRNNEIDKWAQQASALSSTEIVPRIIGSQPEKRPRRGSIIDRVIVQSDSSQSSSEQDRLILRRVDPMKYSFVKLYPADEGILHKFLARQNVEPVDKHRLYDLLDAKKNFSTLERAFEDRRDVQMSYFLSIIRMHNKFVMELAQLSATDASARRYGYSRLQRKKDSLQDDIGSSSKLLKMCEMENLFVAIDSRTRHSATPISATRFTTRSFSTDHARALFGMIAGDPAVKRKVDRLVDSVVPVMTTDEHGTDYVRYHIWLNGSVINAVTHCFENERGEFEMPDSVESVVSKQGELVIFGSKSPYPHQTECADIHDVQEVYVLAVRSTDERDVCVMGPYDVYAVGDTWHISSDFIFGYSGALCVCTHTGLPTALYVGSYIEVDNKLHGTVVSLV